MSQLILFIREVQGLLRSALGVALVVGAGLALWSWLERSRRISPFSAAARGAKSVVDPLLRPVEKVTVRFGAPRTMVPWWGLFALLVLGAALLGLLGFLHDLLAGAYYASVQGPRGMLRLVIGWSFAILQLAVMVRVITSWIGGEYSKVGRIAITLTEWFLGPLRRALPRIGVVDISPIVAWFALALLRGVVLGAL